MKNVLASFVALLLALSQAHAQQVHVPTFFFQEAYMMNAGAAGMSGSLQSSVIYDVQWLDFDDAPSLQYFTVHMPLKGRHGVGLKVQGDRLGPTQNITGLLSYAYFLKLKENLTLSIGIDAGLHNQRLDWAKLEARDGSDPNVFPTDEMEASLVPEVNLGFYLRGDGYSAGLAINQLTRSKYGFTANNVGLDARQKIHSYLHGHYEIPIMDKVKFIPSALLSISEGAPLYLTGVAGLDLNEVLVLQTGFKSGGDWLAGAQIRINTLRVGYMFEYSNAEIRSVGGNSHEFFVQYRFGGKEKQQEAGDSSL